MNKLERKFGKYAISNLSMWMIATYVVGYMISFLMPAVLPYIQLNPYKIFHGEVWRIVTWIFTPPGSFSIFTIIMLFFYYSIGNSLERTWGTFRYNVYIFSGILFTIVGALLLYIICALTGWAGVAQYGTELFGEIISTSFSTYYINLSIFLAFAACYPDMQVMLYFIIPIKIKWLAYLDIAFLLYSFIISGASVRVAIVASLLNFILFFFNSRNMKAMSPGEIKRKRVYREQVAKSTRVTKHKCAICGRTDQDSPNLEFRFCSKCEGNYEYCSDHLFTHEHK